MQPDLETKFKDHAHTGVDSQRINGKNLINAPQSALTTASIGSLTSGGSNNLKTIDADILNNLITRVGELETKLQSLGLLQ